MPDDDALEVHFLEGDTAVLDLQARNDFQIAKLCMRLLAPMRLNKTDNDVNAAPLEVMGFVNHAICLADTSCRPDVELELSSFPPRDEIDEIATRRPRA
jgi:hypothetical protein